jgi:hypothetical protein
MPGSRAAKRKCEAVAAATAAATADEQYNASARQRTSEPYIKQEACSATSSSVPSPDTVQRESTMTEEERREDRASRNRASALKSRNKRRQRLAFLEVEYAKLRGVVERLAAEKARLQTECAMLKRAAGPLGIGAGASASVISATASRASCLTPPPSPMRLVAPVSLTPTSTSENLLVPPPALSAGRPRPSMTAVPAAAPSGRTTAATPRRCGSFAVDGANADLFDDFVTCFDPVAIGGSGGGSFMMMDDDGLAAMMTSPRAAAAATANGSSIASIGGGWSRTKLERSAPADAVPNRLARMISA